MNAPYRLGERLGESAWAEVKLATMFDCCKWDIQSEDHCVLCQFPLILKSSTWQELSRMAERLSAEALAAEEEMVGRPELHASLGIPSSIRRVLKGAKEFRPSAARVMRFDFHLTTDGWQISEVNSDVPGGYNEASGFTSLMASHFSGTRPSPDVAQTYANAMLRSAAGKPVALVHATAYMDDRQVMQYLGGRIAECGGSALLLGPTQISWRRDGTATVGPQELGMVTRFFPADWLARLHDRDQWAHYFAGNGTPMSNPGSAILIQSKRFPLVWNLLDTPLENWRQLMPKSASPDKMHSGDSQEWVFKPAFGRVGEDVAVPGVTPQRIVSAIERAAKKRPEGWVAQKKFHAVPVVTNGIEHYLTLGVYTVEGRAAGVYGRIATKALVDHEALDIAVLIEEGAQR